MNRLEKDEFFRQGTEFPILTQKFATHVFPLTTVAYTHPSDQEMAGRVRGLDF